MIIDIHHHLVNEKGYVENLLREMDRLGIEKCCLSALGPLFDGIFVKGKHSGAIADNSMLAEVFKQHPDRLIGFGFLRPGKDNCSLIDQFIDWGFRGIKITIPLAAYNDKSYWPIYEKAQQHNLPILFHTGILTLPKPQPEENISSVRMLPILLEPVAQAFPKLKIIIAHLGITYTKEAATMARIFPNIYVDLSGKIDGWRSNTTIDEFKKLFYWDGAENKILYGSDVHYDEMEQTIEDHKRIINGIGFTRKQQRNLFYVNAKKLLNV
jgi:uncharacterized protein